MLDGFEWSLYEYEGKIVKAKLSLLSSVSAGIAESVHIWVVPLELGASQKAEQIPLTQGACKKFERYPFSGEKSQDLENFFVGAEYSFGRSTPNFFRIERVYRNREMDSVFVEVKDLQETYQVAPYSIKISDFFHFFNQHKSAK